MVPVMSLWLPILLSAIFVFVVSSVVHMLLPYHRTDYARLPGEDSVLDALRSSGAQPGEYVAPYASTMKEMTEPGYVAKRDRGVGTMLTVMPGGPPNMGAQLTQWFVFCLLVSLFAAYIASRALDPGAAYGNVFRFTSTVAFAAYGLGTWSDSIWFRRKWSTSAKNSFDGLLYALVTGGAFGWLWP